MTVDTYRKADSQTFGGPTKAYAYTCSSCTDNGAGTGTQLVNTMTEEQKHTINVVGLTAEIAAAYVRNNAVPRSELPDLIGAIYSALVKASAAGGPEQREDNRSLLSLSENP